MFGRRICLLAAFLAWPSSATAQQSHCDPGLPTSEENPLHYRPRGASEARTDRCEGIYIQEVSSTTLLVASLTASFVDFDLTSDAPLVVEWAARGDGAIRLRAQALEPRRYYRMDTVRPPGETAYSWPIDLLAALSLRSSDIGVLGWTEHSVGDVARDVYLPLRIRQQTEPPDAERYEVILLPGRELSEVFISLATVGGDGHPETFLQDGEALNYGYYPAGRGVPISLPALTTPGLYYLEIGATLRGGGASSIEVWFFHADD